MWQEAVGAVGRRRKEASQALQRWRKQDAEVSRILRAHRAERWYARVPVSLLSPTALPASFVFPANFPPGNFTRRSTPQLSPTPTPATQCIDLTASLTVCTPRPRKPPAATLRVFTGHDTLRAPYNPGQPDTRRTGSSPSGGPYTAT